MSDDGHVEWVRGGPLAPPLFGPGALSDDSSTDEESFVFPDELSGRRLDPASAPWRPGPGNFGWTPGQESRDEVAPVAEVARLAVDVRGLAAGLARGVEEHDAGVGEGVPFPLGPHAPHEAHHPKAPPKPDCADVAPVVTHGVVHGQDGQHLPGQEIGAPCRPIPPSSPRAPLGELLSRLGAEDWLLAAAADAERHPRSHAVRELDTGYTPDFLVELD